MKNSNLNSVLEQTYRKKFENVVTSFRETSIDNKLNFDKHITDLCRKASTQLNVLYRFKNSLPYQAKSVLIQSFIYANFNYCPLIWHFSSSKSLLKVEMIQKNELYVLYIITTTNSSYESLLNNAKKSLMSVIWLRSVCRNIQNCK